MTAPEFTLPANLFSEVFPFHFAFCRNLRVVQTGRVLQRLYPQLERGSSITQHFCIDRPSIALTCEALLEQQQAFFLLASLHNGMQMRGQMIYLESESLFFFLGSPWITDLAALNTYGLKLSDFAVHDPLGDLLIFMRAQATALIDIRSLAMKLKEQKEEMQRTLSLLQTTFDATADGILVTNMTGEVLHFNQKWADLWQLSISRSTRLDERQLLEFFASALKDSKGTFAKIRALYSQPHQAQYDLWELKDDRVFECHSHPQYLGTEVIGRVWSFRDITERQRTEAKIRYQASHDSLTGLPNRMQFNERLEAVLHQPQAIGQKWAVGFLDLDRFKLINDSLGHTAGDWLIKAVAQQLKASIRGGDVIARWAGDEFIFLLPVNRRTDAQQVAQRILDGFQTKLQFADYCLHVTASIGIAFYPDDGQDAETLVKHADAALYQAKADGRNNYRMFSPLMNSKASEWLELENSLHQALDREEFVLHYQPIVDTTTGKIVQMEALIRWQHPELGLLFPNQFIELAEENGLIVPIGEWVLKTACAQNQAWRKAGLLPIKVAVNLSARQFQQIELAEIVAAILQSAQLDPASLELEITENLAMQDLAITRSLLQELHQLGVSLALDDFGMGYSSLNHLKHFPLDSIKIDRSFIQELRAGSRDAAIVRALIDLGRGLDLKIIAEGVETQEQAELLQVFGCRMMQGYFFSRPVSATGATYLLETEGCSDDFQE